MYDSRPEYDSSRIVSLQKPVVETLSELLEYKARDVSHSYSDGVSRQQRSVFYVDNEDLEVEILLPDLTELTVYRHPVHTEIHIATEDYHRGPLKHMAMLTLSQYIDDSAPFINEYHFEVYKSGAIQTLVSFNDLVRGEGLESRPMTPYDFGGLLRCIEKAVKVISQADETVRNNERG